MRRLERRNAQRYESDLSEASSPSGSEVSPAIEDRHARSFHWFSPRSRQSSFRIHGSSNREVEDICRELGLSGPEDFTITAADWEASRHRSISDHLPQSRFRTDNGEDLNHGESPYEVPNETNEERPAAGIRGPRPPLLESPFPVSADVEERSDVEVERREVEGDDSDRDFIVTSGVDDSSSSATEVDFAVSPVLVAESHMIMDWKHGKELGRGSFGTVYEAINYDGFFFAVKEVSLLDQGCNAQNCIQQLEHEISLLSSLEHPNIVQYLGTEKGEAKLFIFLELVTQGSLASLYRKYQLQDSQVSSYTRQILKGLKYLHEKNVIHRDIKCANILVHASGSVKLADFGLAKQMSKIDETKSCKGSVYWMAPEVVNPRVSYGSAADIWSLGCTVLEMLTQNIPYPNLEWQQAFLKIGSGIGPDIPESLSAESRDFIRQCLQVNPANRPDAGRLLDHAFVNRHYFTGATIGSDGSSRGRHLQAT